MHNHLSGLFDPFTQRTSLYELLPLLLLATLLCVAAAVLAFQFVLMFFRRERRPAGKDIDTLLQGLSGWRALLLRLLFPRAAAERQQLSDEVRRLRTLGEAAENEKNAQLEHNQRAQRRLSEMQREIEVLQGALTEKRAAYDEETSKLEALSQHSRHLEKQLDEIVLELERIYRNAPEKPAPVEAVPPASPESPTTGSPGPLTFPSPSPETPAAPKDEATQLRALLLAYRQRVKERKW
jgi:DNA repair exonuclease SbcCD ATPase subunit